MGLDSLVVPPRNEATSAIFCAKESEGMTYWYNTKNYPEKMSKIYKNMSNDMSEDMLEKMSRRLLEEMSRRNVRRYVRQKYQKRCQNQ